MCAVISATLSELLSQCAYGLAPTVESKIHSGISTAKAIAHERKAGVIMSTWKCKQARSAGARLQRGQNTTQPLE
jgi:hypothetical protein